ncbi:putative RNA-directed DNA polymerase [Helianthus annuus]|nr:putative RNA-directed DNA polymerase [Helianthus annuus]
MLPGVRQGDPLSPFIFIIAKEALTGFMKKATTMGCIKGIKLPNNGPNLTHLMYADDVIFMGEWDEGNIKNIIRLMRCFHISGLKLSPKNSSLFGIGVDTNLLLNVANGIRCDVGKFPCKYLGLLVGANMNQVKHWKGVINCVKSRLSKWKSKVLFVGGRSTLLKSVLDSLPLYYFSLYKAPKGVLDSLEALRRCFFWEVMMKKKKMAWVCWERVLGPVEKGGLGFGSLRTMNISLLLKWWWRYKTESGSLWKRTVEAIHNNPSSWSYLLIKVGIAGVWNGIIKEERDLVEWDVQVSQLLFVAGIKDGSSVRFWLDKWNDVEKKKHR